MYKFTLWFCIFRLDNTRLSSKYIVFSVIFHQYQSVSWSVGRSAGMPVCLPASLFVLLYVHGAIFLSIYLWGLCIPAHMLFFLPCTGSWMCMQRKYNLISTACVCASSKYLTCSLTLFVLMI